MALVLVGDGVLLAEILQEPYLRCCISDCSFRTQRTMHSPSTYCPSTKPRPLNLSSSLTKHLNTVSSLSDLCESNDSVPGEGKEDAAQAKPRVTTRSRCPEGHDATVCRCGERLGGRGVEESRGGY
jgi:hypothetical protein